MISWHRPGQKVTPNDGDSWYRSDGSKHTFGPQVGEVYEIKRVVMARMPGAAELPAFLFAEFLGNVWDARDFSPVFPEIIDQLRTLPSIPPEFERAPVKEPEHA